MIENSLRHREWAAVVEQTPWLFEALLLALSLGAGWAALVLIERPSARLWKAVRIDVGPARLTPRRVPLPRGACAAIIAAFLALPILLGQRPPATTGSPAVVESSDGEPSFGSGIPGDSDDSDPDGAQPTEPDAAPDEPEEDLSGLA